MAGASWSGRTSYPTPGHPTERVGDGFLFAGRLTPDKGIAPMLEGWARSEAWRRHRLRIAGSGPLDSLLIGLDPALRVEPLGLLGHEATLAAVRDAAVTVVPSVWPEPFGRGVIEAAAHGRPALAVPRPAGWARSSTTASPGGWPNPTQTVSLRRFDAPPTPSTTPTSAGRHAPPTSSTTPATHRSACSTVNSGRSPVPAREHT